jgi:hypothetical protein
MKSKKQIFPEVPKTLVLEYDLNEFRREPHSPDIRNILTLTLDDCKLDRTYQGGLDEENLFYNKGFPFERDELELFEVGIFGITEVKTKIGIYRKEKSEARLDDLGERGGNHSILRLEYKLITG